MLDSLRFVQGAVARKDFVAALTHFRIKDGRILGYNGHISLSCPIDLALDCMPKATSFVKAIQTCKDTISLHMTAGGRLSVKSGSFKALVDCVSDGFPEVEPEGQEVELKGNILETLKALEPFIAEDASRPWARGILFRGPSAFATNNVVLIERWLGHTMPIELNIPKAAVVELLRIGEEPTSMQVQENSCTFHFSNHRWLKTSLYSTQWPDLARVLGAESSPSPLPEGIFAALQDLKPFMNKLGQVFVFPGRVSTEATEDQGASVEVEGLTTTGVFHLEQLLSLCGLADVLDLTLYPKPCIFYGDNLRGAIVGMRG